MSTNGTSTAQTATASDTIPTAEIGAPNAPEQLNLLVVPAIPPRFRLDERTRRCGLEHVAALRALMAEQAAARNRSPQRMRPPNRQIAA